MISKSLSFEKALILTRGWPNEDVVLINISTSQWDLPLALLATLNAPNS